MQAIELSLWKRGIPVTLSLLKDAIKKDKPVNVTSPVFAKTYVQESDRKRSTKENLLTTITVLQEFRPGFDFKDITYTFLRDFEVHLKEKGNSVNTIAKHQGKALAVLERYDIVTDFAKIGLNSEANKYLAQLATLARIRKHITYHTARHGEFSFLLKFKHLQFFAA